MAAVSERIEARLREIVGDKVRTDRVELGSGSDDRLDAGPAAEDAGFSHADVSP